MGTEAEAVVKLRQELDSLGGTASIASLSIKVKWGQGDLKLHQQGTFRKFLTNYPELFSLDDKNVTLIHRSPAPMKAKAGQPVPGNEDAVQQRTLSRAKRGWEAEEESPLVASSKILQPTPKAPKANTFSEDEVGAETAMGAAKGNGKAFPPLTPPPAFRKRGWGNDGEGQGGPETKFPHLADQGPSTEQTSAPGAPTAKMGPPGNKASGPIGGKSPKFGEKAPPADAKGASAPAETGVSEPPPWQRARGKGGDRNASRIGGGDTAPADKGSVKGGKQWGKGVVDDQGRGDGSMRLQQQLLQTVPSGTRPAWEEDALSDDELPQAICEYKVSGIDFEIRSLAKRLEPSEDYTKTCQRLFAFVRSAASSCSLKGVNFPSVEDCGARAQGTCIDGSDFDILLRVEPGMSAEERGKISAVLRGAFDAHPFKSHVTVHDGMHLYPHTIAPVSVEIKTTPGATTQCLAHLLIADAPSTPEKPLTLDGVIAQLCDAGSPSDTWCARDLVRIVKLWATNHGLVKQHEGFMNGVVWTLVALFFLQKLKLVPTYTSILEGNTEPLNQKPPPLAQALRGFFEYLAMRAQSDRSLSVTTGQETGNTELLFVEDPVTLRVANEQRNLADGLQPQQWNKILEEAKKAAERLNARPQRWFHWAEIIDPRVVPQDKIQKLDQLRQILADAASQADGKGGMLIDSKGSFEDQSSFEGKGMAFVGKGDEGKGSVKGACSGKGVFGGKGGGDGMDYEGQSKGDFDGKGDYGGNGKSELDGKGKASFKSDGKVAFEGKGVFDGKGAKGNLDDSKGCYDHKGNGKGKYDGKGGFAGTTTSDDRGEQEEDVPPQEESSNGKGDGASTAKAYGKGGKASYWYGKGGKEESGGSYKGGKYRYGHF